jgi:hypothetical protein
VAETSSLLNCRTGNRSGGSNPPFTAKGEKPGSAGFFYAPSPSQACLSEGRQGHKNACGETAGFFAFEASPSGITSRPKGGAVIPGTVTTQIPRQPPPSGITSRPKGGAVIPGTVTTQIPRQPPLQGSPADRREAQ